MDIFVSLVGAWQDWRYRNGPTRGDVKRARNARGFIPQNDAPMRAWFRVNTERQAQYDMLRQQSSPRMVGGCGTPGCDGRCGR